MSIEELAQAWHHQIARQGDRQIDAQASGKRAALAKQFFDFFHLIKHVAAALVQQYTVLGRLHPPRRALQQAHTEPLFEHADLF